MSDVEFNLIDQSAIKTFLDVVYRRRLAGKSVGVKFIDRKRTLDQNAHFYALYRAIGQQWDGETEKTVRCICKLHYGVPILRAADEDFRDFYDRAIKNTLEYEQKLEAMEFVPVTSFFTTAQGAEYIDTILHEFSMKGFALADPRQEAAYGNHK